MTSTFNLDWLDARLKQRQEERRRNQINFRNPDLPVVDAAAFAQPLSDLTITLMHKVEREAYPGPPPAIAVDTGMILRQLNATYNLIRFVNADDTRFGNVGYHRSYSFAILPLVRTMIDGFYNCTALLDDPSRSRVFRISGYFRVREELRADEQRYSGNPKWSDYLCEVRRRLDTGMRAEGLSNADLDDKKNEWPLLSSYLRTKPDTPHKQTLRMLTYGFWKEYSSISHASFDGLASLFPFIATDRLSHEQRDALEEVAERHIAMHIGRVAGILLCLLTEIQHIHKFDGADIDRRLAMVWNPLLPMLEVRELYDVRYKGLLRSPEKPE